MNRASTRWKGWAMALLGAVAAGCAGAGADSLRTARSPGLEARPSGPGAAEYYPLAVGHRWTYEVISPEGKRVDEKTVHILREQGGLFFDDQGGQLTADSFGIRDQKRYLLRQPVELGRTWTNILSPASVEHYKIADVGTDCEVPAGHFPRCVVVESRNRMNDQGVLVNELTFAPGVGIVRIRTAAEVQGRRIPQLTIALKSYRLEGAAAANR